MIRYIIRALKHFVKFAFIAAVVVVALHLAGFTQGGINEIFTNGWNAIWQMALMFLAISAIYPKLIYMEVFIPAIGENESRTAKLAEFFSSHGYIVEKQDSESISFRQKGFGNKFKRLFEDRITVKYTLEGIRIEGPRKDLYPISNAIEDLFSEN